MECRQCGACCIAMSISSPIPGMPNGKPAGVRCIQLNQRYRCALFGKKERPEICKRFPPMPDTCGTGGLQAFKLIKAMEEATK